MTSEITKEATPIDQLECFKQNLREWIMIAGTNKAHTDTKKKKRKKNISIIIMKQNKTKLTRQNMYSYKYDNTINMYFGIML